MKTIAEKVNESIASRPWLSWRRQDFEKKLVLPAGKFTHPGSLAPLIIAIALSVIFYLALPMISIPQNYIDMFTQRGLIPYFIVFFTAWALGVLFIKARKLKTQVSALKLNIIPPDSPGFIITPVSVEQVIAKLNKEVEDPQEFILTRRILIALGNLRNIGNISDVDKILNTQSEHDESAIDSSYTLLRGLIWAIPVLGFVGTVLGLSVALGSFGGVLAAAQQMDQLKDALQTVTGGLSTAFETTLEGLVATLIIHMLMIGVQRREEQFLDDCKDYCQKHIVSKLRLSSM